MCVCVYIPYKHDIESTYTLIRPDDVYLAFIYTQRKTHTNTHQSVFIFHGIDKHNYPGIQNPENFPNNSTSERFSCRSQMRFPT